MNKAPPTLCFCLDVMDKTRNNQSNHKMKSPKTGHRERTRSSSGGRHSHTHTSQTSDTHLKQYEVGITVVVCHSLCLLIK